MNESPYHISGHKRRVLKKKRSHLADVVKHFWWHHDRLTFYKDGDEANGKIEAKAHLKHIKTELSIIERMLRRQKHE